MKKHSLFFLLLMLPTLTGLAQDNLLEQLENESEEEPRSVIAIFKGTRIINSHSVKTRSKNELDFIISHRFGRLNSGPYELFGLDNAFIRLGLEYGITDKLNVGVGRSSFDKSYDTFLKYNLIQQKQKNGSPIALTLFASNAIKTSPRNQDTNEEISFSARLAQSVSFLVARKFSDKFSLQLSPTFVHRNQVRVGENNDTFSLGSGFRYMITKSLSFNFEHYLRFNPHETNGTYNPIAIGVDIETGGHVFQLQLTNSRGMINRAIIEETTGDFSRGDIHFGFNIVRTFQL